MRRQADVFQFDGRRRFAPVIVTAVFAKARPTRLEPVPLNVTADPARIFPWNFEPVPMVPVVPGAQYTLQACPPAAMTTWEVAVVRLVPTWITHTPEDGPASVRMPLVRPAELLKQYTPGASVLPPSACPVRLLAGGHVLALSAV